MLRCLMSRFNLQQDNGCAAVIVLSQWGWIKKCMPHFEDVLLQKKYLDINENKLTKIFYF